MGSIINLAEAIMNRLDTATLAGGSLEGINAVYWGKHDTARKGNNLPVINLELKKSEEIPFATKGMFCDELTIAVQIICNKLQNDINRYYDSTGTYKGIIYWYEKVKDALDNTTAGSPDLTIDATANDFAKYSAEFIEGDDVIEAVIEIKVKSKAYVKGSLQV